MQVLTLVSRSDSILRSKLLRLVGNSPNRSVFQGPSINSVPQVRTRKRAVAAGHVQQKASFPQNKLHPCQFLGALGSVPELTKGVSRSDASYRKPPLAALYVIICFQGSGLQQTINCWQLYVTLASPLPLIFPSSVGFSAASQSRSSALLSLPCATVTLFTPLKLPSCCCNSSNTFISRHPCVFYLLCATVVTSLPSFIGFPFAVHQPFSLI